MSSSFPTTINPREVVFYDSHATSWWFGKFRPLLEYNALRIPFLERAVHHIISVATATTERTVKQLDDCNVLDVGCGGGFLAEGIAKKGAGVTGIDISAKTIEIAQNHKEESVSEARAAANLKEIDGLSKLTYSLASVTVFAENLRNKCANNNQACQSPSLPSCLYDAVISSEVIEHVESWPVFLKGCVDCLKPGGVLVITTPNRSLLSFFSVIFMAEYVLRMLPKGTHEYNRFVKPEELTASLKMLGFELLELQGVLYIPWPIQTWFRVPTTAIMYMASYRKMIDTADKSD